MRVVDYLHQIDTPKLRRLAKFLRVARWWQWRRENLIVRLEWKLDPWKDRGMY